MTLHMVIGDPHAKPDQDLSRFELAGKFAVDKQPDVIVNIGDWFDMASLNSYDFGKISFEGRRYSVDLFAGKDALYMFEGALETHNNQKRRNKEKLYRPRKIALEGNHEYRAAKVPVLSPNMEGTVGRQDIQEAFEGLRWEYVPYEGATPGIINVDGVNYAHYFISGILGRPIGGEYPAATLIKKQYASCVAGHSHLRDFADRTSADGRRLTAAIVGCFIEEYENYAGAANDMWWSGITLLHDVHDGEFDVEFVSFERLAGLYR